MSYLTALTLKLHISRIQSKVLLAKTCGLKDVSLACDRTTLERALCGKIPAVKTSFNEKQNKKTLYGSMFKEVSRRWCDVRFSLCHHRHLFLRIHHKTFSNIHIELNLTYKIPRLFPLKHWLYTTKYLVPSVTTQSE